MPPKKVAPQEDHPNEAFFRDRRDAENPDKQFWRNRSDENLCFGFANCTIGGVGRGALCRSKVAHGLFCRHHSYQQPLGGLTDWLSRDDDQSDQSDDSDDSDDSDEVGKGALSASAGASAGASAKGGFKKTLTGRGGTNKAFRSGKRVTRSGVKAASSRGKTSGSSVANSGSSEEEATSEEQLTCSKGGTSNSGVKAKSSFKKVIAQESSSENDRSEENNSQEDSEQEDSEQEDSEQNDSSKEEVGDDEDSEEDPTIKNPLPPAGTIRLCEMPQCKNRSLNIPEHLTYEGNFLCEDHIDDNGRRCQRISRGDFPGRRCPRFVPDSELSYEITQAALVRIEIMPEVRGADDNVSSIAWLCGRCAYDAGLDEGVKYGIDSFHDNYEEALKYEDRDVKFLGEYFENAERGILKQQKEPVSASGSESEPAAKKAKTGRKVKFEILSSSLATPCAKGEAKANQEKKRKIKSASSSIAREMPLLQPLDERTFEEGNVGVRWGVPMYYPAELPGGKIVIFTDPSHTLADLKRTRTDDEDTTDEEDSVDSDGTANAQN